MQTLEDTKNCLPEKFQCQNANIIDICCKFSYCIIWIHVKYKIYLNIDLQICLYLFLNCFFFFKTARKSPPATPLPQCPICNAVAFLIQMLICQQHRLRGHCPSFLTTLVSHKKHLHSAFLQSFSQRKTNIINRT